MPPSKKQGVMFNFLVETKDKVTGASSYEASDAINPVAVLLEDISITTSLDKMVTPYGFVPIVQPMGVKARECRISGSFASCMPMAGTPDFCGNEDALRGIYEKDEEMLGRAIKVSDDEGLVLELSYQSPIWIINDFNWDRDAKEMGKYRFTMTLGYFWSKGASETKIYGEDFINSKANVSFYAAINDQPRKKIAKVRIQKSTFEINRGSFEVLDVSGSIKKDQYVEIWCDTDADNPVIEGYIEDVKNASNGAVTVSMVEVGYYLYSAHVANKQKGLFVPRVYIRNPVDRDSGVKQRLTIAQMLKIIMSYYPVGAFWDYEPGEGVDTTKQWGSDIYVPNSSNYLPPMMISGMSVGEAVNLLLKENCGLDFWFDRENDNKLTYGYINKERQIEVETEPIVSTELIKSSSDETTPDFVIVYNNSGDHRIVGNYITGHKYYAYKLNTDVPTMSLGEIAQRIFNDLTLDRKQYKVTFPAGVVKLSENDVFGKGSYGLGDYTCFPSMEFKSGSAEFASNVGNDLWQIKDVIITSEYTQVVVGPSHRSIFDIFGNTIQPITSAVVNYEVETWKSSPAVTDPPSQDD